MKIKVSVTFTEADKPEDCLLTEEEFARWLENNGGSLRDRLVAEGNEWIDMHLEMDGHMGNCMLEHSEE